MVKLKERIYFDITQDEKLDLVEDVAKLEDHKSKLEVEKKNVESRYKTDIASTKSKISELWSYIHSGKQDRIVECEVELEGDMLTFYYEGQEVLKRPANPDELEQFQNNLFDD